MLSLPRFFLAAAVAATVAATPLLATTPSSHAAASTARGASAATVRAPRHAPANHAPRPDPQCSTGCPMFH
jgi:hypothetical protein